MRRGAGDKARLVPWRGLWPLLCKRGMACTHAPLQVREVGWDAFRQALLIRAAASSPGSSVPK